MKKKLISLAAAALLTCSAVMTASAAETARVWETFDSYGGNAQKMAQTWKELSGGDKANLQLIADGKDGHQMKMSWEAGQAGWGGIGRDVNEDWSMFEGVRINVKDGDCNTVVFQFSCLQEDGTSTPFDGQFDMTSAGEKYLPFSAFVPKDWCTLKELDLTAVTNVTISVVTSRGTFFTIDDIALVDEDGKYDPNATTAPPPTTTAAPTQAPTTAAPTEPDETKPAASEAVKTTKANESSVPVDGDEEGGLSTGAIVGIVIAAVVVLAGAGAAVYFLVIRKKKSV